MIDRDYDSYELNILDNTRIKPLLEQIRLNDLSFRFFISSVYWSPTSYDVVQKHNKEIRRTISHSSRMTSEWFFIEKHQRWWFHRHILLEDAQAADGKNPPPDGLSIEDLNPSCRTLGNGLNDSQKMELLKKVFRLLPFIPNGQSGLDIRPIHNLEKLTAYCSKQFEFVRPAYEVIDPVSSDMEITYLLDHKQDGTHWKTRHKAIPPRSYRSLQTTPLETFFSGLKPI